jgi:hypothetical protein
MDPDSIPVAAAAQAPARRTQPLARFADAAAPLPRPHTERSALAVR